MTNYDTKYNDQPVCPYCGNKEEGSDVTKSTTLTCGNCEENFIVEPDYQISYTTKCEKGKHDWGEEMKSDDIDSKFCKRCGECSIIFRGEWI